MIISKENLKTIAVNFSGRMIDTTPDNSPRYINIWNEHNVEAIRLVKDGMIEYSITIMGDEICRVETLCHHNQLLVDPINVIIQKLVASAQKYIDQAIDQEVMSIIETVRDLRFNYSLFTGNLSAIVTTVETRNGSSIRFIDIHQGLKMVYSAPYSAPNENTMHEVLKTVLKDTYLNNGMTISMP